MILQTVKHVNNGTPTLDKAAPVSIDWTSDDNWYKPVRAKVDPLRPMVLFSGKKSSGNYWYPVKPGAKFSQPLVWTEA